MGPGLGSPHLTLPYLTIAAAAAAAAVVVRGQTLQTKVESYFKLHRPKKVSTRNINTQQQEFSAESILVKQKHMSMTC